MRDKGYLNDEDFIRIFIREQSTVRRSGPLLIRRKLLEKGAEQSLVDTWLPSEYSIEKELGNARILLEKKIKSAGAGQGKERMQKLSRYLQQKGFTWETIQTVFTEADINAD